MDNQQKHIAKEFESELKQLLKKYDAFFECFDETGYSDDVSLLVHFNQLKNGEKVVTRPYFEINLGSTVSN